MIPMITRLIDGGNRAMDSEAVPRQFEVIQAADVALDQSQAEERDRLTIALL
ncbi:hypothetical protein Oscil6304_3146 [Oscillatoria acuminata PCC 6304]|uniref:Uncharacterized protein n=2 Tax=Oscillatoria acuminata TaxID=118323 RepID=K9TJZ4_9CYAN|nr:hypothetical protein Oscil6304_3146 [Oscillatoria acuminata PCC 6304]